ncbi:MAG: hypothetical protein V7785_21505 [Bermanella sp.]
MYKITLYGILLLMTACARLDHVQISDIDQSQGSLKPISVKVSEFAIELAVIADVGSRLATNHNTQNSLKEIRDILALMNMGPRTGNPVFNDNYAENVLEQLYVQCPSGKITGLRSTREATTYGAVSGEIVRLNAFCII